MTLGTPVYPRPGEIIFTPFTVLLALRVIVAVAVSVGAVNFIVQTVWQLPSNVMFLTAPFCITVFAESPPLHVQFQLIITRGGNSYPDPQFVMTTVPGMFSFFMVGRVAAALFEKYTDSG